MTTLADAPIGRSLRINRIVGTDFAARMARMGLYEGAKLLRLADTSSIGPVKVRGSKGDAVLSGWLAGQVVIHLDDDRRLPLLECRARDSGHVEGVTGQTVVEDSLRELGFAEGDRLEFIRRVPPMAYTYSVNGKGKYSMDESLAAHIVGDTPSGPGQFSSVGVSESFVVRRILPSDHAESTLASLKVTEGAELVLFSVSATQALDSGPEHNIACASRDGMRLYFREQDAMGILVSVEAEPSPQIQRLYGLNSEF